MKWIYNRLVSAALADLRKIADDKEVEIESLYKEVERLEDIIVAQSQEVDGLVRAGGLLEKEIAREGDNATANILCFLTLAGGQIEVPHDLVKAVKESGAVAVYTFPEGERKTVVTLKSSPEHNRE